MVASPDNYYADVHRAPLLVPAATPPGPPRASEDHAARRGGWLTDRHANYPTTDIAVSSMDNATRRALEAALHDVPGYGHALADVAVGEL
ncbi:hypothetical protein JL720_13591 [Aureococcus anophagefferens]|nr:hypothetical protein JL720_13591 [Aureococcus anophagefferens]